MKPHANDGLADRGPRGSGVFDKDRFVQAARRQWWVVAQAVVLVALVAVLLEARQPTTYTATAQVIPQVSADVRTTQQLAGGESVAASSGATDRFLAAQTQVVTSPAVAERAAAALGGPVGEHRVRVDSSVGALVISATSASPEVAMATANTLAIVYLEDRMEAATARIDETVASLQAQLDELQVLVDQLAPVAEVDPSAARQLESLQNRQATVFDRQQGLAIERGLTSVGEIISPADSASRSGPQLLRAGGLGAALGLVLGLALALVRERLDDRLRTPADVESTSGLSTLATVPFSTDVTSGEQLPVIDHPRSGFAESVRALRTTLHFLGIDEPVRSLVVTSPAPEDGKSLLSCNLAVAYAQAGYRTLIVSADLRRPRIEVRFGFDSGLQGLVDVVAHAPLERQAEPAGEASGTVVTSTVAALDNVIMPTRIDNLDLLPAGTRPQNPAEVLASRRTTAVVEELSARYEMVIFDTPPMLFTDAAALGLKVDGVIFVISSAKTRARQLNRAAAAFADGPVRLLGVVVNKIKLFRFRSYGYGYYGHDYSRYYEDGRTRRRRGGRHRTNGSTPDPSPSDRRA